MLARPRQARLCLVDHVGFHALSAAGICLGLHGSARPFRISVVVPNAAARCAWSRWWIPPCSSRARSAAWDSGIRRPACRAGGGPTGSGGAPGRMPMATGSWCPSSRTARSPITGRARGFPELVKRTQRLSPVLMSARQELSDGDDGRWGRGVVMARPWVPATAPTLGGPGPSAFPLDPRRAVYYTIPMVQRRQADLAPRGREGGGCARRAAESNFLSVLAPSVLRPIHARGDQRDGGRIHYMNHAAKAAGDTPAPAAESETGREALKMIAHRPENLFGQPSIAHLVGMGEGIAAGCRGSAQRGEQIPVQPQSVADIIEPDGVGELRVEQAHQMAPGGKRARLPVHARRPRQLRHQMRRNEIANLPQHRKFVSAWSWPWSFLFLFFHVPAERQGNISTPSHLFSPAIRWL